MLFGDTHCGDNAGLTPESRIAPGTAYTAAQLALWRWWKKEVNAFGQFDAAIHLGDAVEGANSKNTIELYCANTDEQGVIAAECCAVIPCKRENFYAVYGTPFHTAGTYSYEDNFAAELGIAKPKTVQRLNIGGLVRINAKHTVSRSSIPYGQGTPTYKEMVNEILNAALQEDASADICVRGHAHYSVGMRVRDHESIVVPCLKYPGSVFGRKLPEAQYDMGFGVLEIYGKGDWRYIPVHFPIRLTNSREWTEVGNTVKNTGKVTEVKRGKRKTGRN